MDDHKEHNEVVVENNQLNRNFIVGLIVIVVVVFAAVWYYLLAMNNDSVSEYEAKVVQLELTIDEERQKYNELLKKYDVEGTPKLRHLF